jgi:hypothetical protein
MYHLISLKNMDIALSYMVFQGIKTEATEICESEKKIKVFIHTRLEAKFIVPDWGI